MSSDEVSFISSDLDDVDDDNFSVEQDIVEEIFCSTAIDNIFNSKEFKDSCKKDDKIYVKVGKSQQADEVLLRYATDYQNSVFVSERQPIQKLMVEYRSIATNPNIVSNIRNYVIQNLFALDMFELEYMISDQFVMTQKPFSAWISQNNSVIVTPQLLSSCQSYHQNVIKYAQYLYDGLRKLNNSEKALQQQFSLQNIILKFQEYFDMLKQFKSAPQPQLILDDQRDQYKHLFNDCIEMLLSHANDSNLELKEYLKTFYLYQNECYLSSEATDYLKQLNLQTKQDQKFDLDLHRKQIHTEAAACQKKFSEYQIALRSINAIIDGMILGGEAVEFISLAQKISPLYDISDDKYNVFQENVNISNRYNKQERNIDILPFKIQTSIIDYLTSMLGQEKAIILLKDRINDTNPLYLYIKNSIVLLYSLPYFSHLVYINKLNESMIQFIEDCSNKTLLSLTNVQFNEIIDPLMGHTPNVQQVREAIQQFKLVVQQLETSIIIKVINKIDDLITNAIEQPISFVEQYTGDRQHFNEVLNQLEQSFNNEDYSILLDTVQQCDQLNAFLQGTINNNQLQIFEDNDTFTSQFDLFRQNQIQNTETKFQVFVEIEQKLLQLIALNPAIQQLQILFTLKHGMISSCPKEFKDIQIETDPSAIQKALKNSDAVDLEQTFEKQIVNVVFDPLDPFSPGLFIQNKPLLLYTKQFAKQQNKYQFLLWKQLHSYKESYETDILFSQNQQFYFFNMSLENDSESISSYIKQSFDSIRDRTDVIVKENVILYLEQEQLSLLQNEFFGEISRLSNQQGFNPLIFQKDQSITDSFTTPTKMIYPFIDIEDVIPSIKPQVQAAISNFRICVCVPPNVQTFLSNQQDSQSPPCTFVVLDSQGRYIDHIFLYKYDKSMPNPQNDKLLEQEIHQFFNKYGSINDEVGDVEVPKQDLVCFLERFMKQFKQNSWEIQRILDEAQLQDFLCAHGVCAVTMLITSVDQQLLFANLENTLKYLNLPIPNYYDVQGVIIEQQAYNQKILLPAKGRNAIVGKNLFFVNDLFFRRSFKCQHIKSILLQKVLSEIPSSLLEVAELQHFDYSFDQGAGIIYTTENEFKDFQQKFGLYPQKIIEQLIQHDQNEQKMRNMLVSSHRQKQCNILSRYNVQAKVDFFVPAKVIELNFDEEKEIRIPFEQQSISGVKTKAPTLKLFDRSVILGIWAGRYFLDPLSSLCCLTLGGLEMDNLLNVSLYTILPQFIPYQSQFFVKEVIPYKQQQLFYRNIKCQFAEIARYAIQVQVCKNTIDFNQIFVSPHFTYQLVYVPQLSPRKLSLIFLKLSNSESQKGTHNHLNFDHFLKYVDCVLKEEFVSRLEQELPHLIDESVFEDKLKSFVNQNLISQKKVTQGELADANVDLFYKISESETISPTDFHLDNKTDIYNIFLEMTLCEVLIQKIAFLDYVDDNIEKKEDLVRLFKECKSNDVVITLVEQSKNSPSIFEHMQELFRHFIEQRMLDSVLPQLADYQNITNISILPENVDDLLNFQFQDQCDLRILQIIEILLASNAVKDKRSKIAHSRLFSNDLISYLTQADLLLISKTVQQRVDSIAQYVKVTQNTFLNLPGSPYATPIDMAFTRDYFDFKQNILYNTIQQLSKHYSNAFNPESYQLFHKVTTNMVRDNIVDRNWDPKMKINVVMIPCYLSKYGEFQRDIDIPDLESSEESDFRQNRKKRAQQKESREFFCQQIPNSTITALSWFDQICVNRQLRKMAQFMVYFMSKFSIKYNGIIINEVKVGLEASQQIFQDSKHVLEFVNQLEVLDSKFDSLLELKKQDIIDNLGNIIQIIFNPLGSQDMISLISKYNSIINLNEFKHFCSNDDLLVQSKYRIYQDDEYLVQLFFTKFYDLELQQQSQLIKQLKNQDFLLFISKLFQYSFQPKCQDQQYFELQQDNIDIDTTLQFGTDYSSFLETMIGRETETKLKSDDIQSIQSIVRQQDFQQVLKLSCDWLSKYDFDFSYGYDTDQFVDIYNQILVFFTGHNNCQQTRIDPMSYFVSSCNVSNLKYFSRYQPFLVEIKSHKKEQYKSLQGKIKYFEVVSQKYKNLKGILPAGGIDEGINFDQNFIAFLEQLDPELGEAAFQTYIQYQYEGKIGQKKLVTEVYGNLLENQWRDLLLSNMLSNYLSQKGGLLSSRVVLSNGSDVYPQRMFNELFLNVSNTHILSDQEYKQKIEQLKQKQTIVSTEISLNRINFCYNLQDAFFQQGDESHFRLYRTISLAQGHGLNQGLQQLERFRSLSQETISHLIDLSAVYLSDFNKEQINDTIFSTISINANDRLKSTIPNSDELQQLFNEFRNLVFPTEWILSQNFYNFKAILAMFNYIQSPQYVSVLRNINSQVSQMRFARAIASVYFLKNLPSLKDQLVSQSLKDKQLSCGFLAVDNNYNELKLVIRLNKVDDSNSDIFKIKVLEDQMQKPIKNGMVQSSELSGLLSIAQYAPFSELDERSTLIQFTTLEQIHDIFVKQILVRAKEIMRSPHYANKERMEEFKQKKENTYLIRLFNASRCQFIIMYRDNQISRRTEAFFLRSDGCIFRNKLIKWESFKDFISHVHGVYKTGKPVDTKYNKDEF